MSQVSSTASTSELIDLTAEAVYDPATDSYAYTQALINGALFVANDNVDQVSGTGIFGTFVKIDGNPGSTEQGYNYDAAALDAQFDEGNDAPHNHAVLLGSLEMVTRADGNQYYVFLLDSNEPNSKTRLLSLDALQVYTANTGELTGFDQPHAQGGTGTGFGDRASLVYDMDGRGDVSVIIDSTIASGSGKPDLSVYIPVANFAGVDPHSTYVYLYSAFGYQGGIYEANSGFEEWGAPLAANTGEPANPQLTIDKSADLQQVDAAGEMINYTIRVANTGNVDLTGVVLTDGFAPATLTGGDADTDGVLDIGETWLYSASHLVSQAELNAGNALVNVASVQSDQTDIRSDDAITTVLQKPSLSIEKNADVGEVDAAGQVINYTIKVANTGNIDLSGVVLTDSFAAATLTSGDTDGDGVLDVNETWLYAAAHTVTQAEMNAGGALLNVASVSSDRTASQQDDASTAIIQRPSLSIDKTADLAAVDAAGQVIHYNIKVSNTGNIDLSGVVLDDSFAAATLTSGDNDGDGVLDVNETWLYSASHVVTQAEMNAGGTLLNVASVSSDRTASQQDDASTAVIQRPSLSIDKTADLAAVDAAGQVIHYNIKVSNTGNIDLSGVVLDDSFAAATLSSGDNDGDGVLDVNETWLYSASHVVTQAEMNAGGALLNVASVSSDRTASQQDDASTAVIQRPSLSIDKTADLAAVDAAGKVIHYNIKVANTGNIDLTGVVLDDSFAAATLASGDNDGDGVLDVNETWLYSAAHVVTQAEMDNGSTLVNVASVHTDRIAEQQDDAATAIIQKPSLDIVKTLASWIDTNGDGMHDGGDILNYNIHIANTGNVTLTGVSLNDPLTGGLLAKDLVLGVGTSQDISTSYKLTWADVNNKGAVDGTADNRITNTATADSDQTAPKSASVDVAIDYVFREGQAGRTQGFWGNHTEAWDGSTANNSKWQKLVGSDLFAAEVNPLANGDVLLGDVDHNGIISGSEIGLRVSNAIAKSILSSSVTGDSRISMLQQAIATQLNINNHDLIPGKAWADALTADRVAGDLITESVQWLKSYGGAALADGVLNSQDYSTSTGKFLTALTSAQATSFWNTSRDVDGTANDVHATGEDLKNVLMAYNTNKLVTSTTGQVAWNAETVDPQHAIKIVGVADNGADAFWGVAHDNMANFGLGWHG